MTQTDALLDLLRARGAYGVTPMDALTAIGSFRLAARISDLKAAGHRIDVDRVRTPGGAYVARYVLVVPTPPAQVGMFFDATPQGDHR